MREFFFIFNIQMLQMRTKVSEVKLLLCVLLFAASLVCAYYAVYVKAGASGSMGFVFISIAPGRFSVLLFKNAKQKAN